MPIFQTSHTSIIGGVAILIGVRDTRFVPCAFGTCYRTGRQLHAVRLLGLSAGTLADRTLSFDTVREVSIRTVFVFSATTCLVRLAGRIFFVGALIVFAASTQLGFVCVHIGHTIGPQVVLAVGVFGASTTIICTNRTLSRTVTVDSTLCTLAPSAMWGATFAVGILFVPVFKALKLLAANVTDATFLGSDSIFGVFLDIVALSTLDPFVLTTGSLPAGHVTVGVVGVLNEANAFGGAACVTCRIHFFVALITRGVQHGKAEHKREAQQGSKPTSNDLQALFQHQCRLVPIHGEKQGFRLN